MLKSLGQPSLPQTSIVFEDAACFNHETQSKVKSVPKIPETVYIQARTLLQYIDGTWPAKTRDSAAALGLQGH